MPFMPIRFSQLSPDHYHVLAALNTEMTYADLMQLLADSGHSVERGRMLGVLSILRQRRLVDRRHRPDPRGNVPGLWFRTDAGAAYLEKNPTAPEAGERQSPPTLSPEAVDREGEFDS